MFRPITLLTLSACILFTSLLCTSHVAAQAPPRIMVNPQGHTARIHNLLFTQDGARIISISEDKTIRVWNAATTEMMAQYETEIGDGWEGMLYASALSPNGKLLAVAGYPVHTATENYIILIDLEKGEQIATAIGHTNVINALTFNAQGTRLVSGSDDGTLIIWRVGEGPDLPQVTTMHIGVPVTTFAYNTHTDHLAVAASERNIQLYKLADVEEGARQSPIRTYTRHKGIVNKLTYAPNGAYLVSSSLENELIVWQPDGKILKEFKLDKDDHPVNALAFSYDAKILVALDVTGRAISWTMPAGSKLADFKAHDNTVFSAAFSPSLSGNYLVASAGGVHNEILLWNPINGLPVKNIKGKGRAIQDLAFTNNMELLISRDFEKPEFKMGFNFEAMMVNRHPATFMPSSAGQKGVTQTGANSLQLPKNKSVRTNEAEDGRILDYQMLPDGSVVVASDFSLKQYDANGYLSKEFVGHTGAVRALAVSRDGRYLASGGEDQAIILWKLDETGFAPTIRQVFEGEDWGAYFAALPVDSLTREPTRQAWMNVIQFLKGHGDKIYKDLEAAYKQLGETMIPFATLFLTDDLEWVCWTPKGYFTCSSDGSGYFGWHINQGIQHLARFYAAEQFFEILYRPQEMSKSIAEGKRVEDLLRQAGERIFDLGRLHKPSVGFFDVANATRNNLLRYEGGKLYTEAHTVPLTVEIFDGGGGVKEVNIYQNDKLIITDREVKTSGKGEKMVKTYAVEMANEVNEFKVKVINYQKIESRADVLHIAYTGDAIATASLHILSVGINTYKNPAYNLNYARPDATAFTQKLKEKGQRIFKEVTHVAVYDEDATKPNILKAFQTVIARAKPEDVFLFYYAGHGTLDEEHQNQYYLVPTDITKLYGDPAQLKSRGISAEELRDLLMEVKSQKQIILMDACHSGGALKTMTVRAAAADEKAIVQLARSSGVVMIASSGSKQFATEFAQLQHGVFTYALLEALDGKADHGDDKLTVNELKIYMEERVPELTQQFGGQAQYPTGYITGNDFPMAVQPKK